MRQKSKYIFNSSILTALVIALAILLNVVVSAVCNAVPLRVDLTSVKIFTLSEDSQNLLKTLEKDVEIYYFSETGGELSSLVQILKSYKSASSHINITVTDATADPQLVLSLKTSGAGNITNDMLVVNCGDRFSSLALASLVTVDSNNNTYSKIEDKLTTAINIVTGDRELFAAFTSGHNEQYYADLSSALEDSGISCSQVDLKMTDIPKNIQVLFIVAPKLDFSSDEIEKLNLFLKGGGSACYLADNRSVGTDLLHKYFRQSWGVLLKGNLVCEQNSSRIYKVPYNFVPVLSEHYICDGIAANVQWTASEEIQTDYVYGVSPVYFAQTSETGLIYDASTKTYSDNGVYNLAAALTRTEGEKLNSRLVVYGTASTFSAANLSEGSLGNRSLLIKTYEFLNRDDETSFSIKAKRMSVTSLSMSDTLAAFYTVAFCILPPVLVLTLGFIVWLKRRHL